MRLLKIVINVLNILILGVEPVVILLLLYLKNGGFPEFPWWSAGIFISWAFTINLWVALGALFEKKYSPSSQIGFFVFNFVAPISLALLGNGDLWSTFYLISSYHFLAIGIALGVLMIGGPFLDLKRPLLQTIALAVGGGALFVFGVTLPAIWAESLVFPSLLDDPLRYLTILAEAYFILRLLYWESVYYNSTP